MELVIHSAILVIGWGNHCSVILSKLREFRSFFTGNEEKMQGMQGCHSKSEEIPNFERSM